VLKFEHDPIVESRVTDLVTWYSGRVGGVAGRDVVGVMDLWSRYSCLGGGLSRSDDGVFE
jgi:hypothetical protein